MFNNIHGAPINPVDEEKVQELIDSILTNGWTGSPILYHSSIGLITGSHRSVALERISQMYYKDELTTEQKKIVEKVDEEGNYSLDVTEIVDAWIDEHPEADLQYDAIGHVFEGTEVEQWKNEIYEW